FEELGVGDRVVGMRLELDRHAARSRAALGHGLWRPRVPRIKQQVESRFPRFKGIVLSGPDRAAAPRSQGMSITIADIEAARRAIAGHVLRTPMLPAPKLSALTGASVCVKYENLQVTNSFKERGALNKLA